MAERKAEHKGETELGIEERKEGLERAEIAPRTWKDENLTPPIAAGPKPAKIDLEIRAKRAAHKANPTPVPVLLRKADELAKGQGLKQGPSKRSSKR